MTNDSILRFIFKNTPIRGAAVHLDTAWSAIKQFQQWPAPVARLMGEMTAGALLLASSIKFEGALILQIQGDGPVRLAIAEVRNGLLVRATAKLNDSMAITDDMGTKALVNACGRGQCAVMLDPKDRREGEPLYQGVVSLAGDSLAEGLMNYMQQSEQIHTRLWFAADEKNAAGLMIQKMPGMGGDDAHLNDDPETLNRIETLAETITDKELLTLSTHEVVHRLFWEEEPQVLSEAMPKFACTCSRGRVRAMIAQLGKDEALGIIAEMGHIEVRCDFCGRTERFDLNDVMAIFDSGETTRH